MKRNLIFLLLVLTSLGISAQFSQETDTIFKKRVLENTEINLLTSFYTQDGLNAAVTGGIGTEALNDFATNITVAVPVGEDGILTIDGTISAYSSASSSNLNPFTGASSGDDDDDDDDDDKQGLQKLAPDTTGSPWVESSGASGSDVWYSGVIGYSHTSDNRNNTYSANISFATEYDYTSFGAGLSYTGLFNERNTVVGIGTSIYLDTWRPEYPTEVISYVEENGDLNSGFFSGIDILDQNGVPIDKNGNYVWKPVNNTLVVNKGRNTYTVSLSLSQILTKWAQISIFSDITFQNGWLANPMQRVYFSDVDNFYIGNASSIPNYTDPSNKDVFQLADDIERLPDNRLKIPIGTRLNIYINEFFVVRMYYRYYFDDWGISSNTFNIELPIKAGDKFTFYSNFRHYNQTAADYFAPYETHLSTDQFYTSDFDLSEFSANQYGLGIKYTDIFMNARVWKIGVKNLMLNYNYYQRSTDLTAHIITFGVNFVLE